MTTIPELVTLNVPGYFTLTDSQISAPLTVTFQGREVQGTFWQRLKTAWAVLTGKATHLYAAQSVVAGCKFTAPLSIER